MITEREMASALGMSRARKARPIAKPISTLVTLSVRRGGTGQPFRFQHRAATVIRLVAQLEAEKEARRQGLEPYCLIDIEVEA